MSPTNATFAPANSLQFPPLYLDEPAQAPTSTIGVPLSLMRLAANEPTEPPEPTYPLDGAVSLDPATFPNPPPRTSGQIPPSTIPNIEHLLRRYRITVRYDVIKKRTRITMPGQSGSSDNFDNVALTQILSLAALNGLQSGAIPAVIEAIGDRNQFNPVAEWITSRPWDGVDRLPDVYSTLRQREDFPAQLKEIIMHRWLLSATAAALTPTGFRSRGVLTLQGPQGIGKTAWARSLISDSTLARQVIKVDHHMDGSKDSQISAAEHFIVELGELEGSLRKDIAKLKGFLTADQDKVRRPYARMDSEYQRRTVFCATVNDENFLVDSTGNTRFWTVPLISIDHQHGIDMQQVFAQLAGEWHAGEQHWLTPEEETWLEEMNKGHLTVSALRERMLDALDLARRGENGLPAKTPTEVLKGLGVENPSNVQAKECAVILRDLLGEPKRINGRDRWRIPYQGVSDLGVGGFCMPPPGVPDTGPGGF